MRAFLAFDIPADVTDYLNAIVDRLARRIDGVKWVRNEGIHITVKFLGDIDDDFGPTMKDALQSIGAQHAPISARLGQLDAFPNRRSGRVIVVKLSQGGEDIRSVFSEVEQKLEALQVAREKRELVPHITLGRRRVPKSFPNGDLLPVEEKTFAVEDLVLYKSTLTPGGAIYAPIWKIKLGGEVR
jgi:RNA 2',3'-cyclic 3'-phosphodiesterase